MLATPVTAPGETAARRALRAQIARLEGELAATLASTYPRVTAPPRHAGLRAPRLLGLGELEAARDALAARLSNVHRRVEEQAARAGGRARAAGRACSPTRPAHKGERISHPELGLPGCTTYAVLPRLGPVGLLTGWWRVKISSGCPLPG